MEAMQEGSRIHRKIQRRAGADYHAEIPLKFIVSYEEYDLAIEGRADGIIYEEGLLEETSRFLEDPRMDLEEGQEEAKPFVMIDEIKGVYLDVEQMAEPNAVHLAQAKCYAFIFATQHALPAIGVQMTYCNLDTEEIRRFQMHYSYDEIEAWFLELVASYKKWSDFLFHHKMIRRQIHPGFGIPLCLPAGAKETGNGCLPQYHARKDLVFTGTDRDGQDSGYHLSCHTGDGAEYGRQDLLSDCQKCDRCRGTRYLSSDGRTGL